MKAIGICIFIIGIVLTIISSIRFLESREKSKNMIPDEVKEEPVPVYASPWTGIFFMSVGGSILILTKKKIRVDADAE
jgi:hypothetical protein